MALRILSSRLLKRDMPSRIYVTSNASMSSEVGKPKPIKESLRSKIASRIPIGKLDAADPTQEPISYKDIKLPDVTELATGEHKLFLLAFENGFIDPFCNLPVERKPGTGTPENPVKIESFADERIVGCVCEESQSYFNYTTVYRGEKKRCRCGHWMELVDAPKFWEKIPRDDLLTIPFFRDLEQEGKLDKFLAGEMPELMFESH